MAYVLAFLVFVLVMAGMAVGVMCGRRSLKGSCGGVGPGGEGGCVCGQNPGGCRLMPGPPPHTPSPLASHPELLTVR